PFELMSGKIIGIALVGLTQFAIWIVLTVSLSAFISNRFQIQRFDKAHIAQTLQHTPDISQTMEMHQIVEALNSVPFVQIIGCFLFFFLGGYLLYGALFAAIGSAVDSETDTQQFMLPVTLPLVASFLAVQGIVQDPDGAMAFWLSVIPFTSPIAMMVRLPYGVPMGELVLSMALLVVAFCGAIWLSGRIYRTGILMYGKKASYAEIIKWIKL
ncbi:MAG: ABC transporter permease, partial [Cytophagales bacterium]|nr:ABC transporter permease [Cytophagales bacterium]